MPTLNFPDDILPSTSSFGLQSNTEAFTSPLNRATQTVERPGALWKARLTFTTISELQQRQLKGFLAALNGMAGRINLWPHGSPTAMIAGSLSGYSPRVNGSIAPTDSKLVHTQGWPANTVVMRIGEFLQVGSELKMVTSDVSTNSGGICSIAVSPPLRADPSPDAPIIVDKPCAVMRLASDTWDFVSTPAFRHEAFSIDFIEVPQ